MRGVPDYGHPPVGDPAHHHSPCHGGKFLRLIDDDVSEGPRTVVIRSFGGSSVVGDALALRQLLGVNEVVGHEDLRVDLILEVLGCGAGQNIERLLGLHQFLAPLLPLRGLVVGRAGADQIGDFVEQGHITHRERRAGRTLEGGPVILAPSGGSRTDCRRGRQQVSENPLWFESGPKGQNRADEFLVVAHLIGDIGDLGPRQYLGVVE